MRTMYPSAELLLPDKIPSQQSPLSPEWTHAITTLMGHPLSSEPGTHIQKWIIYHRIHKYTMFALKWNPTQFKLDIHLQMYQETDGSLAYLKGHTVRKPTDVFSEHHDYELFLLQKEFDAPNDNPNHYDIHTCENQDDILLHATNLSNIFALPQFMAQHTCAYQEPTVDPIAVPTASQASCDHTIKPKCAHSPMDFPVQWFKFIHPSPKPRMTKTPFQIAVHKAYSPIASMNYHWTINLHDGYPLFLVMKQEGYITPSLHIPKHDLSSLAPPKGEMKSSFSWTSSTLCFGEPTLGKLNKVKLLCSLSSSTLWDPTPAITEVWHMAHFWVSYGRCTMPGSPMGRSAGSSRRWTG